MKLKVLVTQLCPTLCVPIDCSPPGSSVRVILQVRILEWVAVSFSRASSLFICLLCLLRFPQLHLTTLPVVFKRYVFIWLYQVLIPARGICIASFRIFHCSAQTLVTMHGLSSCGLHGPSCSAACGILDMGSFSLGIEPRSPELQGGFLTPGQSGNSL